MERSETRWNEIDQMEQRETRWNEVGPDETKRDQKECISDLEGTERDLICAPAFNLVPFRSI